jgi:hypothetical protein
MSAFYDLADLVLVPSGYKSGKIYAQKPLTTDGQLTFTRASTATRVNASGLIESVASGVPRLDYLGSTCCKLLLEPQRSNLVAWSEAFENGAWTKLDTAATANAGTSPDGTANADKIVPNTTSTRHIIFQAFTTSTVRTFSVFAKAAGQNFLTMRLDDDTPEINVYFNLSTGTIGSTAGGSPTMTSYGNGWYRCTVTYTPSGTETIYAVLGSANQNGVQAYAGNGTDGILLYGAMLEAGAYATSYVKTEAAAVTRLADGAGTGDIFGKTFTLNADFGLYWEGVINGTNAYPLFYSGGNYASGADFRSYFTYTGTNLQLFGVGEVLSGNVAVSLTAGTYYKILVKRVGSTIKWYVNGTEYANATGFTTTTVKMRSLFGSTLGAPNHESVAQALIFETTLSDAQGKELTTL